MLINYGSTKSGKRRRRTLLARVAAWAARRAGPAALSALVLLGGLMVLVRRQPEDLVVGGALAVVGAAALVWIFAVDGPNHERSAVLRDGAEAPIATVDTGVEKVAQLELAIGELRAKLAANEELIASTVQTSSMPAIDDIQSPRNHG